MERRPRRLLRQLVSVTVAVTFLLLIAGSLSPSTATANTVLGTTGCATSAARTVPAALGGGVSLSSEDCTITFGSSDGTAMLHAYQDDSGGTALHRGSTGALDMSFSTDGRLEDDHSAGADRYYGVAIQPDGKIVVAGVQGTGLETYVRRYLPNGALDPSFNSGGEHLFVGSYDVRDLALAADGSIFVLGYGGNRVQVFKLTPAGDLDPSWNGGTWTNHPFTAAGGSAIQAESLTIARSGEIYVAGYTPMRGENDFAVLNYTADGRLDPTFDGDGLRIVDIGATDNGRGVIEQPDGRIVVVGLATMATGDVGVVRLLADGQLDPTFDGDGIRTYPIGASDDDARAVLQRPTGELLVVGNRRSGDRDPFALQLRADGTPDTSFGSGGVAVIAIPASDDLVYDAALQPDGAIVAVGVHDIADDDMLFVRFTASGAPDPTFGTNGVRLHSGGNVIEELRGVTVGPDGRIAAVGSSGDAGQEHGDLFVLAIEQIADYATGTSDFTAGGNAFGACLRGIGGGAQTTASTWTVNATCPLSTGAWWRGLPTGMGAASKVATTTGSGVIDATASLRFGLELSGAEQAGAYQAPITIDVIAPNLDPPVSTVAPTISGTARVKAKLTATTGAWSGSAPITHAWQWQRCTPGCADIADATNSTYHPGTADVGATVRVVVTATNSLGSASANSAQTASVAGPAALSAFYVTGFEHQSTSTSGGGVLTSYTGGGTNSPSTTIKRNGAASMRFLTAGTIRQWDVDLPLASTYRSGTMRVYFLVPTLPSTDLPIIEFDSGSSNYCEIGLLSTGQLVARLDNTVLDVGPTIETNRWYRIDVGCNMTAPTWQLPWAIDGVDQGTVTKANANRFLQNVQIGVDVAANAEIYYDDFVATTAIADYPIGPGRVVGLVPDATATHSNHANFGSSTNNGGAWSTVTSADDEQAPGTAQHLDEWPVTTGGTADLVRATATGGYLDYRFTNPGTAGAVNAVSVLVAERSGPGVGRVDIAVDGGAGFQTVQSISPNTALEYQRSTLNTVPTSGAAWDQSSLDALRMRFSSSNVADMPRVDAMLAEVDIAGQDPPINLAAPIVSGTPRVGRVLTTTNGAWTPILGLTYAYQWQNCAPTCSDIAGATNSTYTLVAGDLGDTIQVRVTATNDGGSQVATSAQTIAVGSAAPTLTAFDGFEAGELVTQGNMYESTGAAGGTIGVDTTWARTGRFSGRIANAGSASDTMIAYPMSGTVGVARVSLRLENLPTSGVRELVEFRASDSENCEVHFNAGTGRLGANISASSVPGPVIEAGRWYDLDLRCNVGGATRSLDWMVDGIPRTSVTRPVAAGSIVRLSVGNTGGGTAAYTANYDDVAISQTTANYPLGALSVDALAPNQVGTQDTVASFGQSTNGGATWPAITAEDDVVPGTAGHLDDFPHTFVAGVSGELVRQIATSGHLEYRLADSDRAEAPLSVRGFGTHSAANASGLQEPQLIAELAGSTTTLYSNDIGAPNGSRWTWYGIMNTRPGGGAWTASDIDALRLRLGATSVGAGETTRPWTHNLQVEAAFPSIDPPEPVTPPQVQQPWQSLKVGDELQVDHATWDSPVTSRSWQWLRCPTATTCVPISGATGQSYILGAGDAGSTIRVVETASTVGGRQTIRSSSATQLVATQPTVVMATGFEGGAIAPSIDGTTIYGSPTFGSATVRTGARALATTDVTAMDGFARTLPGGITTGVSRIFVRMVDTTPTSTNTLMAFESSAPIRRCDIDLTTSGRFQIDMFDGVDRDPHLGPMAVPNRWHLIEARLTSSTTTWVCDWSIDGVQQTSSQFNFGATDTIDRVAVVSGFGDFAQVMHFDDWMVSTTSTDFPLGPGRTVALTPDGEGTHASIGSFASDAGALGAMPHLRIDEQPAWSITDWVSQAMSGGSSYLEWTMSNPAERSSSARAVRSVVGFHSSTTAGNDGQTKVVRPGDTDAAAPVVQSGNMSFTSIQWIGAMVTAPGGGWTPNVLDQLNVRTGYAVDVTPAPRWEAAVLEVEYRE